MNKIAIVDTSCLIALENVELLDVLNQLYPRIMITGQVKEEFGETLPDWIIVKTVQKKAKVAELEFQLDKGEASSIALAIETKNSTLIIDEVKGRKIAKSFNLDIIGTIGTLLIAHEKGLITDVLAVIFKMVNQGFRLSDDLLNKLIEMYSKS